MRLILVMIAALCLASCYAVTEVDTPDPRPQATAKGSMLITPAAPSLSSPTVITDKGLLAYDDDLRSCQSNAARTLGKGEDLDATVALQHAIGNKELGPSVSVKYESSSTSTERSYIVKKCLSKRGYAVR